MTDTLAVREKYKEITRKLIENQMTVTAMESCTAGQVASLITDTEGSSAAFRGSYVTYSNEAKIKCGVPKETIDKYSVYSGQTAIAMARASRDAFQADIGIGVTGTMGNVDPENSISSIPGQVWFAICMEELEMVYFKNVEPQPSRSMYKMEVAGLIADELLKLSPFV